MTPETVETTPCSMAPGETVFIERFGRVTQEHAAPGLIVHAPWPVDTVARVSTSLIRSVEFGIDRAPVDDSTVDALALMAERRRIAELEAGGWSALPEVDGAAATDFGFRRCSECSAGFFV